MARRRPVWGWFVVAGLLALVVGTLVYFLGPSRLPRTSTLEPEPTGTINILIVGKDARAVGPVTAEGFRRNKRQDQSHSDIVIVCHVNYDKPSLNLVAVPRDLLVEIPGITAAASNTDFANMEKVAHAYAIGGDRILRRAVEHLLGITIQRSIAFDFDSFRMTFGALQPLLGALRVSGVSLTDRNQALKLARKRHGLQFDDADRCRNALTLVRGVISRAWWLARTRAGNGLIGRVIGIVGEDTDLTSAEVGAVVGNLQRAGFKPARIQTAVLVAEGRSVTLARYNQTLSTYLPVYKEIEKQADRFLRDRDSVEALDFMTQQDFRLPWYFDVDYVTLPADSTEPIVLPFDTTGLDTTERSTLLKELERLRPDTLPADTGR
ncbi:MAG: LCP family protein [bacterium]